MVDVVGRSNLTTELRNLRNYTHYNISVAGYNSKGDGSFAKITVRTEETGQYLFRMPLILFVFLFHLR